jgi:hypothetical protein
MQSAVLFSWPHLRFVDPFTRNELLLGQYYTPGQPKIRGSLNSKKPFRRPLFGMPLAVA